MYDKKTLWLLVIIILVAAAMRLWNLGTNPFVADEFLDVNATYGYHETGVWQAWDFNRGAPSVRDNKASDERAWAYRWQVAFLENHFPPTETTIRMVSALWGVVTTVLLYLIAFAWTKNRWIALIAALLWALSVPAIEINRKVRMYSMFAPVFLTFSWTLYMLLESSTRRVTTLFGKIFNLNYIYLAPALLLGALAMHLHPLTGNIAFVLFVYFIVRAVRDVRVHSAMNRYSIYAALMLIAVVAAAALVPEQFTWFVSTLTFFDDHWHYVGHILANYWHPLIGVLLLGMGTVALARDKKHTTASLWILANFFVILVSAIFLWNRNVGPQYIFFAQTFGLLIAAVGVYQILAAVKKYIPHHKALVYAGVLGLFLVPNYGYFLQTNNTYHITSSGDTANYRKVFDYVKYNSTSGDVLVTRNFRNYYYSGRDVHVFDFGSERTEDALVDEGKVKKITADYIRQIVTDNPHGWIVYSDNDEDYITKEARHYMDDTMTKIDDSSLIRGKVTVYRWSVDM